MKLMKGFSLPELVVALTLVGILTTLGMSRYNAHVAKTRQAEAKVNLSHIASLQGIYRAQHLKYNNLAKVGAGSNCGETALNNNLGFRPQGCDKLRYTYESSGSDKTFTATAKSGSGSEKEIYPGCNDSGKDEWTIDQNLNLNNNRNIVKFCSD